MGYLDELIIDLRHQGTDPLVLLPSCFFKKCRQYRVRRKNEWRRGQWCRTTSLGFLCWRVHHYSQSSPLKRLGELELALMDWSHLRQASVQRGKVQRLLTDHLLVESQMERADAAATNAKGHYRSDYVLWTMSNTTVQPIASAKDLPWRG